MSIDVLAFILGGLLVAVGLLGGGIEIRELKIPPVGRIPRALSFFAGLGFVGLAVLLSTHQIKRPPVVPNEGPRIERQTFPQPIYDGLRLDACYEWAKRCGEEAASAWCKTNGFQRAIDYPTENVGNRGMHTKLIGSLIFPVEASIYSRFAHFLDSFRDC
jgi:hypothetical protein